MFTVQHLSPWKSHMLIGLHVYYRGRAIYDCAAIQNAVQHGLA